MLWQFINATLFTGLYVAVDAEFSQSEAEVRCTAGDGGESVVAASGREMLLSLP